MHKSSRDNNPNCDCCGLTEDDNVHLFLYCTIIKTIWTHYQTVFPKLTGKYYTPQHHLLTLNISNTNKHTRKLTLTIIQIILIPKNTNANTATNKTFEVPHSVHTHN